MELQLKINDGIIVCPICGFDHLHQLNAEYLNTDYGEGIKTRHYCEACPFVFSLMHFQRKGCTHIYWDSIIEIHLDIWNQLLPEDKQQYLKYDPVITERRTDYAPK